MINAVLPVTGISEFIIVVGDFSSANTISFTSAIGGYFHYGTQTQTGNAPAVLFDDAATGITVSGSEGGEYYFRRLAGPVGDSGSNWASFAASAGIRLVHTVQRTIRWGKIGGFNYGILIDMTPASATVNDNWLYGDLLRNNNYNIRFLGPDGHVGGGVNQCQGNHWKPGILSYGSASYAAHIVKDANLIHQYNEWEGVDFASGGGATQYDYQSNAGNQGASRALSGDYGSFLYATNVVLQPDDNIIVHNWFNDTFGNPTKPRIGIANLSRINLGQKQVGVAFAAVTSLAVTFPMAEPDTNYSILATFSVNVGAHWITGKTTTGCTINWVTSSTGSLDYMVYR